MFELARLLFFAAHNENAKKKTLAQIVLSMKYTSKLEIWNAKCRHVNLCTPPKTGDLQTSEPGAPCFGPVR